MSRKLRVASAQIQACALDQANRSLDAIEAMIHQAADREVDLLVLPECAYPAYLIRSQAAFRAAAVMPPEEYLIFLARQARKQGMHIVSGYVEDTHTCLHNAAVLIDDGGQVVGTYRKSFLWGADNEYFQPGDRGGVFETGLGRIGMVICADTRAPEVLARQAMDGAAVIAMPTCWVNVAREPGRYENPQPEYLIQARSREFGLPFVCANKFGMETAHIGYCGRSLITDRCGAVLCEAPGDREELGLAEVEVRDAAAEPYAAPRWSELLETVEATRTPPRRREPVALAVYAGTGPDESGLRGLAADGVEVVVDAAGPAMASGTGIEVLRPEALGELTGSAFGLIGRLGGADCVSFAATRLLALAGMELLCVFDAPDDVALLRTRAVENRVFVVAVRAAEALVVAPDGRVLARACGPAAAPLRVSLNPADAAVKTVAPGTDIWEQRRVRAYSRS